MPFADVVPRCSSAQVANTFSPRTHPRAVLCERMRCVTIVCGLLACKSPSKQPPAPAAENVQTAPSDDAAVQHTKPAAEPMMEYPFTADAAQRVAKAFPNGPATEDARAELGTASPPPERMGPDPTTDWIAELALARPIERTTLVAAIDATPPSSGMNGTHGVYGQTAESTWELAEHDTAKGPYHRVAVTAYVAPLALPITAEELAAETEFALKLFAQLDKRPPRFSMTPQQVLAKGAALVKAASMFSAKEQYVTIAVVPPPRKKFAARLVWDAAYSAGFRWGADASFHWTPSPSTDALHGVELRPPNGSEQIDDLTPEAAVAPKGQEVGPLVLTFKIGSVNQPEAVFDLTVHAANYLARRIGGTVMRADGKPFDEKAARQVVVDLAGRLIAQGITPGSPLAFMLL